MSGSAETVIHPADSLEDVEAKIRETESASPDRVPCPECGKTFTRRGLSAHRRKAHGVSAEEAGPGPSVSEFPGVFDRVAGHAMTVILVGLATTAKRRVIGDPSAELVLPDGWMETAADVHGRLLDKWLGPKMAQYSLEVTAVILWLPVIYGNFIGIASVDSGSGSARGGEVDGGASSGQG